MNLNIKPYLFIAGIIILMFALIAIWRNLIPPGSPEQWDKQYGNLIKPVVLGLFFLFGLMMVPVCLKLFVAMQGKAGNNETARLRWVSQNAKQIMFAIWAVFIIGLCAALPYMIKDGFFKTEVQTQKQDKIN